MGQGTYEAAEELAQASNIEITAVQVEGVHHYQSDLWLQALEQIFQNLRPWCIVLGHTPNGMDLAPGLAVKLGAACITGVEAIQCDKAALCFKRSILGGKMSAWMATHAECLVITVQPGAFRASEKAGGGKATVRVVSVDPSPGKIKFLGREETQTLGSDLQAAQVVVSGGLGIGTLGNTGLLKELASLFPRAVVAGSRPLCDRGWLDYRLQVGLTGATIQPKLYLACGISGSLQHIVGMQDSEFIVAINRDPNAPIFNYADVCIVEDVVAFLRVLSDKLRSYTGRVEHRGDTAHSKEVP
jgi:electron transfer flavoprotein alpha subunit